MYSIAKQLKHNYFINYSKMQDMLRIVKLLKT